MDDIERRLAALGRLDVETTAPPLHAIVRRARIRRSAAAIVSAAAVLVVVIGGYAGVRALAPLERHATDPSVLRAAAFTTQDEGTARTEFDMTIHASGGVFSNDQEIHGSGEIDFEAGLSRSVTESSFLPGAPPVEVIQDGNDVYQRGSDPEDPDQWTHYEIADSGSGLFASDKGPDDYLAMLAAASGRLEALGDEEMDGESVAHYRVEVDPHLFVDELVSQPGLENELDDIHVDLDPMDVWVDAQGRVRRIDVAWATTVDGEQAVTVAADTSFRLFDFGAPVRIEVPDPNEVTEIAPPSFDSPRQPSDGDGSAASLITGDDGIAQPYLVVDARRTELCFFNGPLLAAAATVEHEPTGEELVTF
jgi:hypothetical protein